MGAVLGHEFTVGSSTFIAHGVVISGIVTIGDGVFVGAGAVILPRIKIGNWTVVGAGAVVTKNIPAGVIVVGNPARAIKELDIPEQLGVPWIDHT